MLGAHDDNDNERMHKHEAALKAVAPLVLQSPFDLVDVCIALTESLLFLENSFNIVVRRVLECWCAVRTT